MGAYQRTLYPPRVSTSNPSGSRSAAWWIAVGAWMVVIFLLSSQPDTDPTARHLKIGVYKLAHLIVYTVLGVLVAGGTRHVKMTRAAWWAWVIVVLYAISDEIHQSFVPGRTPLVTDVLIDSLGGLLGIFGHAIRGIMQDGRGWSVATLVGRRRPPPEPDQIAGERSLDKAG